MASLPPRYTATDDDHSSPLYTPSPSTSETTISSNALTGQSSAARWTYKTKHMVIDMGPRIWRTAYPCYGLEGHIEGFLRLSGTPSHVKRISVTLMARLATSSPQNGTNGQFVSKLMSRTIPVYAPSMPGSSSWGDDHHFSMPIPKEINLNGGVSQLPPSTSFWDFGLSCDITYYLKVCMLRKRKGVTTHESQLIQILYLPKSHPSSPPFLSGQHQVKDCLDGATIDNNFRAFSVCSSAPTERHRNSPTLSLSLSRTSYASGESIPFTIAVSSVGPSFYCALRQYTRVTLVKRMTLLRSSAKYDQAVETQIMTGKITSHSEGEGPCILTGVVQAGRAGKDASWCIRDTAQVQYILRVAVKAPKQFTGFIPSAECGMIVELSTDHWGTIEHELNVLGGVPTPAMGLLEFSQPRDDHGSCANLFMC